MNLEKYLKHISFLKIKKISPIIHEDTLSSAIYRIDSLDDKSFVLKILFDEKRFKREIFFHDLIKKSIPTAKIVYLINPTNNLKGAILFEYLDGEIYKNQQITPKIAFEMGSLLAKLHNIKCNFYGDIFSGEKMPATLASAKQMLQSYYDRSYLECEVLLDEKLLKKTKVFFDKEFKKIKTLDGPCIVHRDYKPGNVIFKNEKVLGLIDLEITKFSFAEEDFAQMEALVFEKCHYLKNDFLKGYISIRKLPNLKEVIPILRVAKALGAIGFTIERNTNLNKHKFVFDNNIRFLKTFFLKL